MALLLDDGFLPLLDEELDGFLLAEAGLLVSVIHGALSVCLDKTGSSLRDAFDARAIPGEKMVDNSQTQTRVFVFI